MITEKVTNGTNAIADRLAFQLLRRDVRMIAHGRGRYEFSPVKLNCDPIPALLSLETKGIGLLPNGRGVHCIEKYE